MRIISTIIFLLTIPLIVLIFTMFYGGISTTSIKQELAASNFYPIVTDQIKENVQKADTGDSQDATASLIATMLLQRVTPDYVQGKTEKLIDDTGAWITGKTSTPPVVSFSELTQNLSLVTLNSMTKNGLTIPVWKNLLVLKQIYQVLKILFPILIIFALLSIWGMVHFSKTKAVKFRWVGIVLLISAVSGYTWIFIESTFLSVGEYLLQTNQNKFVVIFTPIVTKLISVFINQYRYYQTFVSISFICIGVICCLISFKLALDESKVKN